MPPVIRTPQQVRLILVLFPYAVAERGELRLSMGGTSDDGNAQFGRLEIFNNGGWGSVCDFEGAFTDFENNAPLTAAAATVACQQLGFEGGGRTQGAVRFRSNKLQSSV